MKKLVLLAALALLASSVSSTTISREEVVVDLESGVITVNMDVEELTTDSFNYRTTHEVTDVEARFAGKPVECFTEEFAVGEEINCETDLESNFSVNLDYRASGLVSPRNGVKMFRYTQPVYRPIDNYTLRVVLPEGTGVVDQSNITAPVIQPETGEVGNMGGRRFYVEWSLQPDLSEALNFQVMYESLEERPLNDFIVYVLAVSVVGVISYLVYRRKSQASASNRLEELGEDEKMIVELLRDKGGEMLQKDIVEETDYSKAKISGVVGNLEDEEVIDKEKEGRSNKVSLRKSFRS
ncbi:MAG: helix-turn-helix transcriptional regulator [Candidatus Nanohalobium sp.]